MLLVCNTHNLGLFCDTVSCEGSSMLRGYAQATDTTFRLNVEISDGCLLLHRKQYNHF
jgi:hypothetical protein